MHIDELHLSTRQDPIYYTKEMSNLKRLLLSETANPRANFLMHSFMYELEYECAKAKGQTTIKTWQTSAECEHVPFSLYPGK